MFWNSKENSEHDEFLLNKLSVSEQKAIEWEFFILMQGT